MEDYTSHEEETGDSQENQWACCSQNEFIKGNFPVALEHLNKLLTSKPSDLKVLLNKSVVEYYCSGLKNTDEFQKSLDNFCQKCGVNGDEMGNSGETDCSVIQLNRCVIMFHQRQYRSAVVILEKMSTMCDTLDESVGIAVCLLLIECHLVCHHPDRAMSVIAHTESTYLPHPLPPSHSPRQEKDSKGSPPGGTGSSSSSSSTSSGVLDEVHCCSSSQDQLREKLQQLRIRALLMMRLVRLAKKEMKSSHTPGSAFTIPMITIKSHLEHLKNDYHKSIKILNQCRNFVESESMNHGPSLGTVYYNNMGVLHVGMGKPTVACLYLQKAMQGTEMELESQKNDGSLYQAGTLVHPELCYNLGVILLHMNKPAKAFDFLIEVAQVHPGNSRLWLRLAECCVAVHQLALRDSSEAANGTPTGFQSFVGAGSHRKFCFKTRISDHNTKICLPGQNSDGAFPEATLEFACSCLRNAMFLLPENVNVNPLTEEQESNGTLPDLYPSAPCAPISGREVARLRISCFTISAYVSLCIGDHVTALKMAESLISINAETSPVHKLLGHLYAAEALICLGRVSDAISHLDINTIKDFPTPSASSASSANAGWGSDVSVTGSQALVYNLSVAFVLRGEYEKAASLLDKVKKGCHGEVPPQVNMLSMYIQLQSGKPISVMDPLQHRVQ